MTHNLLTKVDLFSSGVCWAKMSRHPEGRLVVFIHGFRGKALNTWNRFPTLVEAGPGFQGRDFVFYGYSSRRRRTQVLAIDFREALESLILRPTELLGSTGMLPIRTPDFRFDEVLVVAHSMGALVARQALLDAFQRGDSWPLQVKLALFAPAHMGADLLRLCMATLAPFPIPVELPPESGHLIS